MSINNLIKVFFLLIILLIEIGQSLIPLERNAHSSVLVDKKIYFFGGESDHGDPKKATTLDQILCLDVSKPFNKENPPFEILNVTIPFGSSYATAFLSLQRNIIYLFGWM
jgi:hypothetical protein